MANTKDKVRPRFTPGAKGLRAICVALAVFTVHGVRAELSLSPPPDADGAGPRRYEFDDPSKDIWQGEVGSGFGTTVQTFSIEAGGAYGPAMLGSMENHHLALLSISYGHMVFPLLGEGHWWRGNFEVRLELFGGVQFSPDLDWLVGVAPQVRYNFGTGSRWTPFIEAGAGFSLTGIGSPDLGSLFEFIQQAGAGVHCHLRENVALTFEARYMHLSNAGITEENFGLNAIVGLIGVTKFF